ncbi:hypothetical protein [Streptomyces sp. NPDC054786]
MLAGLLVETNDRRNGKQHLDSLQALRAVPEPMSQYRQMRSMIWAAVVVHRDRTFAAITALTGGLPLAAAGTAAAAAAVAVTCPPV